MLPPNCLINSTVLLYVLLFSRVEDVEHSGESFAKLRRDYRLSFENAA